MARSRDTDDDAPWLAEAEPRGRSQTTVSRRSLFWTLVVLLTLVAVAVIGTVILLAKKENGSTAGYMEAAQAPLIEADGGPYKVKPGDPQGLDVDGEGQTIYATGEGVDYGGTLDPNGAPEEPLPRPGSAPVAEGGMSTGAGPSGPPQDLLPPAAGAAPVPAPAAGATPGAVPAAKPPATAVPAAVMPAPAAAKPLAVPPPAKPVAKPREPLKIDIPADKPKPEARAADAKPAEAKPADAKSKATRAQLGAFKSEAAAEAAWTAAGGAVAGFGKRIEAVETASGTLYRLRASGGDATALCARLAAKGAACKVVQ